MITIIHGDDITESRNYFWDLKKKSENPIALNGLTITSADLNQALQENDLFGTVKEIFIDELISKRKPSKELESLISLISQAPQNVTIWESKSLTKKQIESFGKTISKEFKIPSTVFALLDNIKPNNSKQLIELLHKTLNDKDEEFVFFMLQRQIRMLLTFSSISYTPSAINSSLISEVARLAPWQRGKLSAQAKLFSKESLLTLHNEIFEIELGLKTGQLSMPLIEQLDFLFAKI